VKPVLFHIGPFAVLSYGVIFVPALLLGLFIMWRLYKNNLSFLRYKVTLDSFFDSVLVFIFSFGVGARLLHIFEHFSFFSHNPLLWILFLHFPGFSLLGGILGGMVGLWLFCRYQKQPFTLLLDIMVIGLSFVTAFSRIGSLLAGDSFGRETTFPIRVALAELPGLRHPTQLYEALLFFVLFAFLYFLYQRGKTQKGEITLYFFILVGLIRFFIEMLRGDSVYLGKIAIAQVISILFFVGALGVLAYKKKSHLLGLFKRKTV